MKLQHVFYFIALGMVALDVWGCTDQSDKRTCLAIAGVFFIAGVIKGKK
jgi:hypothetical protein